MALRCFCSFKSFVAVLIVFLYSILLLKLSMRDSRSDYRVEMLGLMNSEPFKDVAGEMYLRKIETASK